MAPCEGCEVAFLGESNHDGRDNEYHLGIDYATIQHVLERLQRGEDTSLRSLNIELMPVQMAQAEAMGLSKSWVRKVELANSHKHQLFMIRRTEVCSESAKRC